MLEKIHLRGKQTLYYYILTSYICTVAPPVGAWIETRLNKRPTQWNPVAPPVGAWIVTGHNLYICINPFISVKTYQMSEG